VVTERFRGWLTQNEMSLFMRASEGSLMVLHKRFGNVDNSTGYCIHLLKGNIY
jgi:hypothetical protein